MLADVERAFWRKLKAVSLVMYLSAGVEIVRSRYGTSSAGTE